VLNAGFLVAQVLDKIHNGMDILILDASCACHTPDIIDAPYRAEVIGAGLPNEKKFTYRLTGPTCLAGDVFGDYSFDEPLNIGDRIVFTDMAHYSMVKNNTFNGMPLPSIALAKDGGTEIIRSFGYGDFKGRL
jgi:carboxynorspermidine decarboxylase